MTERRSHRDICLVKGWNFGEKKSRASFPNHETKACQRRIAAAQTQVVGENLILTITSLEPRAMCWHDHRLVNLRDMPFMLKLYCLCHGSVAEEANGANVVSSLVVVLRCQGTEPDVLEVQIGTDEQTDGVQSVVTIFW